MNFLHQGFHKLLYYIHTHTDRRHRNYYHADSQVGKHTLGFTDLRKTVTIR